MRLGRKIALMLLVGLDACALSSAAADDAMGRWIAIQAEKHGIPGVSVVILGAEAGTAFHAAGFCDIQRRLPCTPDSPFLIGSATKFVTGLMAATASREGIADLDDPLVAKWPEFRLSDDRWREITLRDLLTQRSGLGSVDWPYFWDPALTRKDYMERVAFVPMAKPFRKSWNYANANFVIAGSFLERVTGESWEALVRTRLFYPLEMKQSGFVLPSGGTVGYGRDSDGRYFAIPYVNASAIGPAGTIVTTSRDYANFLGMVLANGKWKGRQVLPAGAVSQATQQVVDLFPDKRSYGMGVYVLKDSSGMVLHHGGMSLGFSAFFAVIPERGWAIAVFVNLDSSPFPEALGFALIDRMKGGSGERAMARWMGNGVAKQAPQKVMAVATPDQRTLQKFIGTFRNPAWGVFDIGLKDSQLIIRYGPFHTVLERSTASTFSFSSAANWERIWLEFVANGDGEPGDFFLQDTDNARPQRFVRVSH